MNVILKRTLAAAASLLLIGGGCLPSQGPETPAPAAPAAELEGAGMKKADEVDAAADAYLEASAEELAAAEQEDGDASLLGATDAELNSYGQTYDEAEF